MHDERVVYDGIYKIDAQDNVGTALVELSPREYYPVFEQGVGKIFHIMPLCKIPKFFKISLKEINEGDQVVKWGHPIGIACVNIRKGSIVHRCNIVFRHSSFTHEEIMFDEHTIENYLEIGKALKKIGKDVVIQMGENVEVHSPKLTINEGVEIGKAVTDIPQGDILYCGNIVEPPSPIKLAWNPEYKKLVRDFYNLINEGYYFSDLIPPPLRKKEKEEAKEGSGLFGDGIFGGGIFENR